MAFKLDSKIPAGALARKVEQPQGGDQGRKPRQQAQTRHYRRRYGPGRCLRSRFARRTGIQRKGILHPGLPAPRALDRRAGRYQRRQELPATTTTRYTVCSTIRSRAATTAPAKPTSTAWPRSRTCIIDQCVGTGRSVRPRVRRPAGQPFVRRRAGFAYVLCPRPDRPAVAAGRLCRTQQGDRCRFGEELSPSRDARHRRSKTARREVSSHAIW